MPRWFQYSVNHQPGAATPNPTKKQNCLKPISPRLKETILPRSLGKTVVHGFKSFSLTLFKPQPCFKTNAQTTQKYFYFLYVVNWESLLFAPLLPTHSDTRSILGLGRAPRVWLTMVPPRAAKRAGCSGPQAVS